MYVFARCDTINIFKVKIDFHLKFQTKMPVVVNVPDANNNQIPAIADVGNAAEINNNQNIEILFSHSQCVIGIHT